MKSWKNSRKSYSIQNKKAWEYNAYEFWVKQSGIPVDRAKRDLENPIGMLKRYSDYFDTYHGIKIANICGSCGKKAVPLVILGAEVTVFDISEDNKKYALEVAAAAEVDLNFEVCDILEIDIQKYGNYFDVVFMEGGVLHHKCELKQAILVKLLYGNHHSDFFGTVFFLTDNVNIFYL